MTCHSELRRSSFSFKFVSGKQCEGEMRLDRFSTVFGHSRKVGFPDFRCVQSHVDAEPRRLRLQ